ncbi:MAG: hypothetical protein DRN28_07185 [Thermoplasmata archaeon]|nr:MAG: hypothetical protein DRN28_07185 [Thermoplasmata archaeon]
MRTLVVGAILVFTTGSAAEVVTKGVLDKLILESARREKEYRKTVQERKMRMKEHERRISNLLAQYERAKGERKFLMMSRLLKEKAEYIDEAMELVDEAEGNVRFALEGLEALRHIIEGRSEEVDPDFKVQIDRAFVNIARFARVFGEEEVKGEVASFLGALDSVLSGFERDEISSYLDLVDSLRERYAGILVGLKLKRDLLDAERRELGWKGDILRWRIFLGKVRKIVQGVGEIRTPKIPEMPRLSKEMPEPTPTYGQDAESKLEEIIRKHSKEGR